LSGLRRGGAYPNHDPGGAQLLDGTARSQAFKRAQQPRASRSQRWKAGVWYDTILGRNLGNNGSILFQKLCSGPSGELMVNHSAFYFTGERNQPSFGSIT
jgi:hypothetical protein